MFKISRKKKRTFIEAKSANEKRRMDLAAYDGAMGTMKSLLTGYHKSLNGLLNFYKGFSEQLKVFYDRDCSYYEYAEKASNAFSTASGVLSENVSVLLGLEDLIKQWSTIISQSKPVVKAFDSEQKRKVHYEDKLVRLKADEELAEHNNIALSKKKSARIARNEMKLGRANQSYEEAEKKFAEVTNGIFIQRFGIMNQFISKFLKNQMEYFGKSSECFTGVSNEIESKFAQPEDSAIYLEKCYGKERWENGEHSSAVEPISERTKKLIEQLRARDEEKEKEIENEPLFLEEEEIAIKQPLNKVKMLRESKLKDMKIGLCSKTEKTDKKKEEKDEINVPYQKGLEDKKKGLKLNVLKPGVGGNVVGKGGVEDPKAAENSNLFSQSPNSKDGSNGGSAWVGAAESNWNSYSAGRIYGSSNKFNFSELHSNMPNKKPSHFGMKMDIGGKFSFDHYDNVIEDTNNQKKGTETKGPPSSFFK